MSNIGLDMKYRILDVLSFFLKLTYNYNETVRRASHAFSVGQIWSLDRLRSMLARLITSSIQIRFLQIVYLEYSWSYWKHQRQLYLYIVIWHLAASAKPLSWREVSNFPWAYIYSETVSTTMRLKTVAHSQFLKPLFLLLGFQFFLSSTTCHDCLLVPHNT